MTNEKVKKEFEFLSIITGILYYPAMGLGIKLGLSMYPILFSKLKGFAIVFGVICTILIAIIFGMLGAMSLYILQTAIENFWRWCIKDRVTKKC